MRRMGLWISWVVILVASSFAVQSEDRLEARIQRVVSRPEFRHARFGMVFYSLDRNETIYQLHPDELFIAASTTKLITMGAALHLLGPEHRFRTRVYRTGAIMPGGVLDGDLVLVASGDPNLSGRIDEQGNLTFQDHDHSYGGPAEPGDPLQVIQSLARQVAGTGIRQISGKVFVDASLFAPGTRELGTGVVISPIVVNDNLVDLLVASGPSVGAPAVATRAPVTSYVRLANEVATGPADSAPSLRLSSEASAEDGTLVLTLTGTVPANSSPLPLRYAVPDPGRYAQILLTEALQREGMRLELAAKGETRDFAKTAAFYTPDHRVAEHVSPPLSEAVKVTLKVSQNLHAGMMPFYLAAHLSPGSRARTGFDEIHDFLAGAGLELGGAQQGDGAGGDARFSPAFMVSFLAHMSKQPYFEVFRKALPVLGRDGTLAEIQRDSPAAGRVLAKTGTFSVGDPLNRRLLVTGKGLAGYLTTAKGERLAFAVYVNNVSIPRDRDAANAIVGQALGEIAAAAY